MDKRRKLIVAGVVLMVLGIAALLAGRLFEWGKQSDVAEKKVPRPPATGPASRILMEYVERVSQEKDAAGRAEARKEAERKLRETGLTPDQAARTLDGMDDSVEPPKAEEKPKGEKK